VKIRILLVDDYTFMRVALRHLIEGEADMEVVAEAETGLKAVALTRKLCPDVIIMDVSMPDMNGVDATRLIMSRRPQVRILSLSMYGDEPYVRAMLDAGAFGYLLKDCVINELPCAIRTVAYGRMYFSPGLSSTAIAEFISRSDKHKSR
jgi:DNA-binding NarL/FixJ family response regulator